MITVGKKERPPVGLILRRPDALSDRRHPRPIGIDAFDRTLGVWGKDDYTVVSPTPAARCQSAGEHLRRASRDRHFLQLTVREKPHIGAIGRPEGIACSLRAGDGRNA